MLFVLSIMIAQIFWFLYLHLYLCLVMHNSLFAERHAIFVFLNAFGAICLSDVYIYNIYKCINVTT